MHFFVNQELIKDLQTAKRQTWEERERLSEHYDEERRITLANKVTFECNHYIPFPLIQLECSLGAKSRKVRAFLPRAFRFIKNAMPRFEPLSCKVNLPSPHGKVTRKENYFIVKRFSAIKPPPLKS